jgi:hypothetical protein
VIKIEERLIASAALQLQPESSSGLPHYALNNGVIDLSLISGEINGMADPNTVTRPV